MIRNNPWTDREVEAHWDNVADIYVRENERVKGTHDQRFRESNLWLDLKPGMKVLNITSRDAEADYYIHKEFPECGVINAEISEGLMEVAAKLRPGIVQVKLESYSSLPFKDREFQRILSLETLEHVAERLFEIGGIGGQGEALYDGAVGLHGGEDEVRPAGVERHDGTLVV